MFYAYLRNLVTLLLWSFNGNGHYHHNTDLGFDKDENYILVSPHRTWWDPIYLAFATRPKQYVFMAKKELFKNRMFRWWLEMCGAFPIDRENPGREAIKYPVNILKKSDRSLIMFPSGSRHSTDVKGGVAVIAKTAKVKILPASYEGPRDLKGLIKGERIDLSFGKPIDISDIRRLNDEGMSIATQRVQDEFDRLDEENKQYANAKKPNPLWLIVRIPTGIISAILLILTCIFSYLASFVWDPKKHSNIKMKDKK